MQANGDGGGGGGLCREEASLSAALGFSFSHSAWQHWLSPAAEPRGCVFVGLECLPQHPSAVPGRPLWIRFGFPGTVDPLWLTQSNAPTSTPALEPSWFISTQEALEIR